MFVAQVQHETLPRRGDVARHLEGEGSLASSLRRSQKEQVALPQAAANAPVQSVKAAREDAHARHAAALHLSLKALQHAVDVYRGRVRLALFHTTHHLSSQRESSKGRQPWSNAS